jgi:hypothetical protein
MTRFHRWFRIALSLIFIFTGQYMLRIAHVADLAMGPRLLYRSRHIYILMAALINLALGAYFVPAPRAGARTTQRVGSVLIAIGSVLLIVSFFNDAPHADLVPLDLVYSKWGILTVAGGTVLHAIASAMRPRVTAAASARDAADRERASL